MKKTLKLFILGFCALCATILLMNSQVFAAVTIPNTETTGTPGEQLKAALESGESVTLTQNITDLTSTIEISDTVTIDGAGHTISVSTFKKIFNLLEGANVTLKNVTIRNTFADGRCIDIREGETKLTLDGANIETTTTGTNSGHDRPINVGGNFENPIDIIIKDSNITAGKAGYAIMVFNPINLKIDNSKITGYTTLYLKGPDDSAGSAGSVINVVNGSVLNGKNDNDGESSTFNVITFEDNNITVNVEDSTLKATGTGAAKQYIFEEKGDLTGNTISVKGTSNIVVKDGFGVNEVPEDEKVLDVAVGVTSNVQIPTEYLPEDVEIKDLGNGKYEVVVTTYKVTIDDVEYTIETGKTVKDLAEYNNIIKKDGYSFKGFQTVEGEEWIDTTKIEKDVVLKTVFEKIIVKYKVEIDGVEYTIEEGKTVKDIEEYNDIIKKEGYNFKGFQTEDGKEWDETAKVEKDITLKTVFEKIQEDDDEKEEQPPVKDEEDKEKEEQDKEPVKDDKNDGKDDVPRTGVESTTITIFAVIAVMSIIGLALTGKKRK